jgi:hypothetical protein
MAERRGPTRPRQTTDNGREKLHCLAGGRHRRPNRPGPHLRKKPHGALLRSMDQRSPRNPDAGFQMPDSTTLLTKRKQPPQRSLPFSQGDGIQPLQNWSMTDLNSSANQTYVTLRSARQPKRYCRSQTRMNPDNAIKAAVPGRAADAQGHRSDRRPNRSMLQAAPWPTHSGKM